MDSISIFSLLKIPFPSHKPLHVGVQPKQKYFDKTLPFCDCRSNSHYADEDCIKDVSFGPFQFYMWKILYPRYFLPVTCTLRNVIRHTASYCNPCEVDLDMQVSCLNIAPLGEVFLWPQYSAVSLCEPGSLLKMSPLLGGKVKRMKHHLFCGG